jgi:VanZ family protein
MFMVRDVVTAVVVLAAPLAVVAAIGVNLRARAMPVARARRLTASDALVVLSLLVIGVATVNPTGAGQQVIELVPRFDGFTLGDFVRNVGGNVALFIPLGIGLGLRGWSLPRALAIGGALAVAIEATQYVAHLGRSSETADVVLNLIGAAIGCTVGRRLDSRRPDEPDVAEPALDSAAAS